MVAGVPLIDSTQSRFVWEVPYYPAWYFPVDAISGQLVPNGNTLRSTSRGEGTRYDVTVNGRTLTDAAWRPQHRGVEGAPGGIGEGGTNDGDVISGAHA